MSEALVKFFPFIWLKLVLCSFSIFHNEFVERKKKNSFQPRHENPFTTIMLTRRNKRTISSHVWMDWKTGSNKRKKKWTADLLLTHYLQGKDFFF